MFRKNNNLFKKKITKDFKEYINKINTYDEYFKMAKYLINEDEDFDLILIKRMKNHLLELCEKNTNSNKDLEKILDYCNENSINIYSYLITNGYGGDYIQACVNKDEACKYFKRLNKELNEFNKSPDSNEVNLVEKITDLYVKGKISCKIYNTLTKDQKTLKIIEKRVIDNSQRYQRKLDGTLCLYDCDDVYVEAIMALT